MTDHPVPADPPSPLTERGSIEDDIRVLDKALDEAIVQAVNLGALIRTDPRIKGSPMALEVKLREVRAALASSPAPAGLDEMAARIRALDAESGESLIDWRDLSPGEMAEALLRTATRPAEDDGSGGQGMHGEVLARPAMTDDCYADPSHQYHSHDDDPLDYSPALAASPASAGLDETLLERERLSIYKTCRRIADALRYPPFDESGPETVGWNDALARFISVVDKKIERYEVRATTRPAEDAGERP